LLSRLVQVTIDVSCTRTCVILVAMVTKELSVFTERWRHFQQCILGTIDL
jgi:hypothetical protein